MKCVCVCVCVCVRVWERQRERKSERRNILCVDVGADPRNEDTLTNGHERDENFYFVIDHLSICVV
jgi:hypothetical protein